MNSWLQLRHTRFNAADPSEDLNLLSIERLRLGLGGHAYSPNLKYFFQDEVAVGAAWYINGHNAK